MARLLAVHGSTYVAKFADRNGGFAIMRYRLKRWWDMPTLWPICFSILFDYDVADIDYERPFELFSLLDIFRNRKVIYPSVLPVIISMLQQGLHALLSIQDDVDSPLHDRGESKSGQTDSLATPGGPTRNRSMSLIKELEARRKLG